MMQVIPAIDLRGGRCVRLRQGDFDQETVFGDDPAAMALRWESEGAARIHLVDLDGAKAGRPVNVEAVKQIVDRVGVPCQLGGGLRDEATIAAWLASGLDRVVVGTQALRDPDWFARMAELFPGRLLLGLDARDGRVATEGWLDVSSIQALTLARQFDRCRSPASSTPTSHVTACSQDRTSSRSLLWPGRQDPGDRLRRDRRAARTSSTWLRCPSRGASSGAPCTRVGSRSARRSGRRRPVRPRCLGVTGPDGPSPVIPFELIRDRIETKSTAPMGE